MKKIIMKPLSEAQMTAMSGGAGIEGVGIDSSLSKFYRQVNVPKLVIFI